MKHYTMLFLVIFLSATLGACTSASTYKKVEQGAKEPVNCATGEADLRVLKSEKVHTAEQIAAGVSSIVPIGLVVGLVTKTEKSKWHVATGDYNDMLDKKIAEIKQTCGLE
jgi:hypothetical protein